jgi:hypothetical protein
MIKLEKFGSDRSIHILDISPETFETFERVRVCGVNARRTFFDQKNVSNVLTYHTLMQPKGKNKYMN